MGGGMPTTYACSTREPDPERPGWLRVKEGRGFIDDHYRVSRWESCRRPDREVILLAAVAIAAAAALSGPASNARRLSGPYATAKVVVRSLGWLPVFWSKPMKDEYWRTHELAPEIAAGYTPEMDFALSAYWPNEYSDDWPSRGADAATAKEQT